LNQLSSYSNAYETTTHAALRSRTFEFQPAFPDSSLREQRCDVSSSAAGVANYTAEFAIADLYENCIAKERAPMLPIPEPIPDIYPDTLESYNEAVPSANFPGIMSIEDAKEKLKSEKEKHWTHLEKKPKVGLSRRDGQVKINKYISRYKSFCHVETAEDYYILANAVRNRRKGLKPQWVGRSKKIPCHLGFGVH